MTPADLIQKLVDVIMQIAHLVKKYPIPIVGSLVTLATLGVILYMNLHTPSAPGVGTPPTGEAHSDFASLGGYKIIGTVLGLEADPSAIALSASDRATDR